MQKQALHIEPGFHQMIMHFKKVESNLKELADTDQYYLLVNAGKGYILNFLSHSTAKRIGGKDREVLNLLTKGNQRNYFLGFKPKTHLSIQI